MKLDAARSRVSLFTFAEGLFSALAHDLELEVTALTGTREGDHAEVHVPVMHVRVVGAVKRGVVDKSVLSASDRVQIEKQIREDVLKGDVTARGDLTGKRASIEISLPTGKTRVTCDVSTTKEANEARAKGSVEVSLKALGIAPVKGPMGAFRVSDKVKVVFDLVFENVVG